MVSRRSLLAGAFVLPVAAVVGSEAKAATPVLPIPVPQDNYANVVDLAGHYLRVSDISFMMHHLSWAMRDMVGVCGPETRQAIDRALGAYHLKTYDIALEGLRTRWATVEFETSVWVPEASLRFFQRKDWLVIRQDPEWIKEHVTVAPRIMNIGFNW